MDNNDSSFPDKLRSEMRETMDRGYKTSVQKIVFVTTLMGFGNINIDNNVSLYPIFYLTPLVAIFFEMSQHMQKYSVRRMGVFLKYNSVDPIENHWEDFVGCYRDHIFRIGSGGFTLLTFAISVWLLGYGQLIGGSQNKPSLKEWSIQSYDWIWFALLLVCYISIRFIGYRQFTRLGEYAGQINGVADKRTKEDRAEKIGSE